jgi:hypothetical protein
MILPRSAEANVNAHRPIRTFNTAVVYYHKFRLIHPDTEYNNQVDISLQVVY